MKVSARNQMKGVIKEITYGPVSTEVVLDVKGTEIVASITSGSARSMGLAVGQEAYAIVKASSVMIGTDH